MRIWSFAVLLALSTCGVARAAVVIDACHAGSRYDVTFAPEAIVFEREGTPRRVELRDTGLFVDGERSVLNAQDTDRVQLLSRELRGLVAPLRSLAQRALDLATGVVRAEARALVADAAIRTELDRRISARAAGLRARIANSRSTRDWQEDALERELDAASADLVPVLASGAGSKALGALLEGDIDAAADTQATALAFGERVQAKIERRIEDLQPQFEAICPDLRRMAELQQGLRDRGGRPLDLVDVAER